MGAPKKMPRLIGAARGIGVGLLADGQLIQIVDDRTATFRFGYFRCLFLAAGRPLWGWAILLKAVTAIEVDMLYALIADRKSTRLLQSLRHLVCRLLLEKKKKN